MKKLLFVFLTLITVVAFAQKKRILQQLLQAQLLPVI